MENKAEQPINGIRSSSNFSRLRALFHREAPGDVGGLHTQHHSSHLANFMLFVSGGFGLPGASGLRTPQIGDPTLGIRSPHASWVPAIAFAVFASILSMSWSVNDWICRRVVVNCYGRGSRNLAGWAELGQCCRSLREEESGRKIGRYIGEIQLLASVTLIINFRQRTRGEVVKGRCCIAPKQTGGWAGKRGEAPQCVVSGAQCYFFGAG